MPPSISTSIQKVILLVLFYSTIAPVSSVPTATWQLNVRHEGHDGIPSPSVAGSTPSSTGAVAGTPGDFRKQNGLDAQKLNAQFKTSKVTDGCQDGQQACVESQFAQCVGGKWALTACAASTSCFALPLVNKPGTSLTCDTPSDASARFEAAGVQGGPDGLGTGTGSPSVSANVPAATGSTDPDANDGNEPCDDSDEPDDDCSDDTDDGDTDCDEDDDGSPLSSSAPASKAQATPSNSTPPFGPITVTTTVTSLPTDSARVAINNALFTRMTVARRQLFTPSPLPASPLPSSSSVVVSPQASPVVVQSSPSIPVVTTISSASNGVVTPTVVVGNNGIVTVTVVSTVTVSATDCAVSSSSATPVIILASATSTSSVVVSSSISNAGSALGQNPTLASPSPSPSVLTTLEAGSSSSTANTNGGLSFSTQTFTPTPASSPTQSGNISELLTATL